MKFIFTLVLVSLLMSCDENSQANEKLDFAFKYDKSKGHAVNVVLMDKTKNIEISLIEIKMEGKSFEVDVLSESDLQKMSDKAIIGYKLSYTEKNYFSTPNIKREDNFYIEKDGKTANGEIYTVHHEYASAAALDGTGRSGMLLKVYELTDEK